MENDKKVYVITLSLDSGYVIKASSEDEAVEQALEWFGECIPDIDVTIDENGEYDCEVEI